VRFRDRDISIGDDQESGKELCGNFTETDIDKLQPLPTRRRVWYETGICTVNLERLECVCEMYCVSLFMVFPAFIIAQSRYGAMITRYPPALSSSVGLSYFILGGL